MLERFKRNNFYNFANSWLNNQYIFIILWLKLLTFLPSANEGNAFSHVYIFVCLVTGNTTWQLPIMHWTSPYSGPCHKWPYSPSVQWSPLLVTSGRQDRRPVHTCSLEDLPRMLTSGGYRSTYGWYASYLNACLCTIFLQEGLFFLNWVTKCTSIEIALWYNNKTR